MTEVAFKMKSTDSIDRIERLRTEGMTTTTYECNYLTCHSHALVPNYA
jgi:hypothetical protein